LNLWGAEPPLDARMAVVTSGLQALAPDVVALQEVREIPGQLANQAETLARALGFSCAFEPAVAFGGGHEGLAILSRQPIAEHAAIELPHAQPTERRILLSARTHVAGVEVWLHTTHLNYRLTHGQQREDQAFAIGEHLAARATEAPQLLMGDFNARPESDEIRFLRGLHSLNGRRVFWQDAWDRLHPGEPGWTWSSANPNTAKLAFLEPDRRLDYIFVSPMRKDGRAAVLACRRVFEQPDRGGVYASDHFGLCADVQIEPT